MISFKDMLHGHIISDIPHAYQINMENLLKKVNALLAARGGSYVYTVTSGIRTEQDQKRINPGAMKSNHLTGHAIDIYDPDLSLTKWIKTDGAKVAEELELYFEEGNLNWVHAADLPPKSGHRWFIPQ